MRKILLLLLDTSSENLLRISLKKKVMHKCIYENEGKGLGLVRQVFFWYAGLGYQKIPNSVVIGVN